MAEYDVVIRGGTIVDGTGAAAYPGDLAIKNGQIAAIGEISGIGAETIDADGHIVTPGWIDIHTHYDGQATWDDQLNPSFDHGVTTVVMGNCGVGFAPVAPGAEHALIDIMEGVEDIPGTALYEGMPWGKWETYPEYLEVLKAKHYTMDVASQVAHGALRAYVLGTEDSFEAAATPEQIERMADLVEQAMLAGAIGVSSNRIVAHTSVSGRSVPGTFAASEELLALAEAMGRTGAGVLQLIPSGSVGSEAYAGGADPHSMAEEVELMGYISRLTDRPVTFTVVQYGQDPEAWRGTLAQSLAENQRGAKLYPQIEARAPGVLSGLTSYHPFQRRETYLKLRDLPFDERVREMAKPEVREAILSDRNILDERPGSVENFAVDMMDRAVGDFFPLGQPLDYEPAPEDSIGALAALSGKTPHAVLYDALLEHDGRSFMFLPHVNYVYNDYGAIREMLLHSETLSGLSDAGAHSKLICDASMPTFMLTHWVRDRKRGERIALEFAVHRMTGRNAEVYGMADRGMLKVGMRADLNIIDLDNLALDFPRLVNDLPAGAGRLVQPAKGYLATFVRGVKTRWRDEDTGQRPGRFLAGAGTRH